MADIVYGCPFGCGALRRASELPVHLSQYHAVRSDHALWISWCVTAGAQVTVQDAPRGGRPLVAVTWPLAGLWPDP